MDTLTDRSANDQTQQRVRASFVKQGLMKHLGASLVDIGKGRVTIELPNRPEVSQHHGYIHAGAMSAIADTAGGYAALTMFPEGTEVLTVEYKINFLAPARGAHLEAVGTVVKAGRTLTVCNLEVFASEGGTRKLITAGQQTLIAVHAGAQ